MRGKGRTFRTILKAIVKASEGEKVYLVMDNDAYAKETAEKVWRNWCVDFASRAAPHVIAFESGGCLIIINRQKFERNQRGLQYDSIFYDHYDSRRR